MHCKILVVRVVGGLVIVVIRAIVVQPPLLSNKRLRFDWKRIEVQLLHQCITVLGRLISIQLLRLYLILLTATTTTDRFKWWHLLVSVLLPLQGNTCSICFSTPPVYLKIRKSIERIHSKTCIWTHNQYTYENRQSDRIQCPPFQTNKQKKEVNFIRLPIIR